MAKSFVELLQEVEPADQQSAAAGLALELCRNPVHVIDKIVSFPSSLTTPEPNILVAALLSNDPSKVPPAQQVFPGPLLRAAIAADLTSSVGVGSHGTTQDNRPPLPTPGAHLANWILERHIESGRDDLVILDSATHLNLLTLLASNKDSKMTSTYVLFDADPTSVHTTVAVEQPTFRPDVTSIAGFLTSLGLLQKFPGSATYTPRDKEADPLHSQRPLSEIAASHDFTRRDSVSRGHLSDVENVLRLLALCPISLLGVFEGDMPKAVAWALETLQCTSVAAYKRQLAIVRPFLDTRRRLDAIIWIQRDSDMETVQHLRSLKPLADQFVVHRSRWGAMHRLGKVPPAVAAAVGRVARLVSKSAESKTLHTRTLRDTNHPADPSLKPHPPATKRPLYLKTTRSGCATAQTVTAELVLLGANEDKTKIEPIEPKANFASFAGGGVSLQWVVPISALADRGPDKSKVFVESPIAQNRFRINTVHDRETVSIELLVQLSVQELDTLQAHWLRHSGRDAKEPIYWAFRDWFRDTPQASPLGPLRYLFSDALALFNLPLPGIVVDHKADGDSRTRVDAELFRPDGVRCQLFALNSSTSTACVFDPSGGGQPLTLWHSIPLGESSPPNGDAVFVHDTLRLWSGPSHSLSVLWVNPFSTGLDSAVTTSAFETSSTEVLSRTTNSSGLNAALTPALPNPNNTPPLDQDTLVGFVALCLSMAMTSTKVRKVYVQAAIAKAMTEHKIDFESIPYARDLNAFEEKLDAILVRDNTSVPVADVRERAGTWLKRLTRVSNGTRRCLLQSLQDYDFQLIRSRNLTTTDWLPCLHPYQTELRTKLAPGKWFGGQRNVAVISSSSQWAKIAQAIGPWSKLSFYLTSVFSDSCSSRFHRLALPTVEPKTADTLLASLSATINSESDSHNDSLVVGSYLSGGFKDPTTSNPNQPLASLAIKQLDAKIKRVYLPLRALLLVDATSSVLYASLAKMASDSVLSTLLTQGLSPGRGKVSTDTWMVLGQPTPAPDDQSNELIDIWGWLSNDNPTGLWTRQQSILVNKLDTELDNELPPTVEGERPPDSAPSPASSPAPARVVATPPPRQSVAAPGPTPTPVVVETAPESVADSKSLPVSVPAPQAPVPRRRRSAAREKRRRSGRRRPVPGSTPASAASAPAVSVLAVPVAPVRTPATPTPTPVASAPAAPAPAPAAPAPTPVTPTPAPVAPATPSSPTPGGPGDDGTAIPGSPLDDDWMLRLELFMGANPALANQNPNLGSELKDRLLNKEPRSESAAGDDDQDLPLQQALEASLRELRRSSSTSSSPVAGGDYVIGSNPGETPAEQAAILTSILQASKQKRQSVSRSPRRSPVAGGASAVEQGESKGAVPREQDPFDIGRFLRAYFDSGSGSNWADAIHQIRAGKKTGCWSWYIFPTPPLPDDAKRPWNNREYAIRSRAEARAFLAYDNGRLRRCLMEIIRVTLYAVNEDGFDPVAIFHSDWPRVLSSMAAFADLAYRDPKDTDLRQFARDLVDMIDPLYFGKPINEQARFPATQVGRRPPPRGGAAPRASAVPDAAPGPVATPIESSSSGTVVEVGDRSTDGKHGLNPENAADQNRARVPHDWGTKQGAEHLVTRGGPDSEEEEEAEAPAEDLGDDWFSSVFGADVQSRGSDPLAVVLDLDDPSGGVPGETKEEEESTDALFAEEPSPAVEGKDFLGDDGDTGSGDVAAGVALGDSGLGDADAPELDSGDLSGVAVGDADTPELDWGDLLGIGVGVGGGARTVTGTGSPADPAAFAVGSLWAEAFPTPTAPPAAAAIGSPLPTAAPTTTAESSSLTPIGPLAPTPAPSGALGALPPPAASSSALPSAAATRATAETKTPAEAAAAARATADALAARLAADRARDDAAARARALARAAAIARARDADQAAREARGRADARARAVAQRAQAEALARALAMSAPAAPAPVAAAPAPFTGGGAATGLAPGPVGGGAWWALPPAPGGGGGGGAPPGSGGGVPPGGGGGLPPGGGGGGGGGVPPGGGGGLPPGGGGGGGGGLPLGGGGGGGGGVPPGGGGGLPPGGGGGGGGGLPPGGGGLPPSGGGGGGRGGRRPLPPAAVVPWAPRPLPGPKQLTFTGPSNIFASNPAPIVPPAVPPLPRVQPSRLTERTALHDTFGPLLSASVVRSIVAYPFRNLNRPSPHGTGQRKATVLYLDLRIGYPRGPLPLDRGQQAELLATNHCTIRKDQFVVRLAALEAPEWPTGIQIPLSKPDHAMRWLHKGEAVPGFEFPVDGVAEVAAAARAAAELPHSTTATIQAAAARKQAELDARERDKQRASHEPVSAALTINSFSHQSFLLRGDTASLASYTTQTGYMGYGGRKEVVLTDSLPGGVAPNTKFVQGNQALTFATVDGGLRVIRLDQTSIQGGGGQTYQTYDFARPPDRLLMDGTVRVHRLQTLIGREVGVDQYNNIWEYKGATSVSPAQRGALTPILHPFAQLPMDQRDPQRMLAWYSPGGNLVVLVTQLIDLPGHPGQHSFIFSTIPGGGAPRPLPGYDLPCPRLYTHLTALNKNRTVLAVCTDKYGFIDHVHQGMPFRRPGTRSIHRGFGRIEVSNPGTFLVETLSGPQD